MPLINHIPYTYRVKNITTGLQYYGVRFAKDCHPDDLWIKYFTSSKAIHLLIEQYGVDNFVVRVTKTFPNAPDKAIDWEGRIVKRILYDPNWLNMNWRGSIHPDAAVIGGLHGSAKTNGGFFYTDGTDVKKFMPGQEPVGWLRYRKPRRNKYTGSTKMKWYYDPDTFKRVYLTITDTPPSNFQPGMGPKQIRSYWYWDPKTGKESQITDLSKIPGGWIKGRNKNRLPPKFLAK